MLKFPEFDIDRKRLKTMKKGELLEFAEKALAAQAQWHELVSQMQIEHDSRLGEIEQDVQNHPSFVALKSQLESYQERYSAMEKLLADTNTKLNRCRAELLRWKPAGRKPIGEDQVDEIRRLRAAGKSVRQIARDVGISKSAVGKYVNTKE